ncbi:hypothetical protein TNCV_4989931 [Trichonephila clavipes]|uniref:Uncharacterized protein n=1 Tax=Trichonephila clavipes TaxID=2585209 RepID=A0A8X6WAX7_TRICX|nr:hypothetical protein TNCV_4989931 [Trichonephila clavipes]
MYCHDPKHQEPWKAMEKPDQCGSNVEVPAGSHLRLTAEHDFLGVNFLWLGLAADEVCPLCSYARMEGFHLLQCTGLDEYPTEDVVSRSWEAWRQMV